MRVGYEIHLEPEASEVIYNCPPEVYRIHYPLIICEIVAQRIFGINPLAAPDLIKCVFRRCEYRIPV
jgi:hypothetical protein